MAVSIDHYSNLRTEFLSVAQSNLNSATLQILKEHYAEEIDSVRKLSYINNIGNLICLLEKRDIVRHDNIEPFLYICNKYLDAIHLETKLIQYNGFLQQSQNHPLCNMYKRDLEHITNTEKLNDAINISGENIPQQCEQGTTRNNSVTDEVELKTTILLCVSERLGRSWRDVARHLGLREYDITAIESSCPFDLKEQSYKALVTCFARRETTNWKLDLLCSLEKARRRDLKEMVENMIFTSKSL